MHSVVDSFIHMLMILFWIIVIFVVVSQIATHPAYGAEIGNGMRGVFAFISSLITSVMAG